MGMMNMIPGIQATGDALHANRVAMDVIAENIANANTTRTADGKPYQRKEVLFESYLPVVEGAQSGFESVRIGGIARDPMPGERQYNPGHPHADAEGFLEMPNVQVSMEMVDLITTSRAYEANLNVIKTSRQMAMQTLAIGR